MTRQNTKYININKVCILQLGTQPEADMAENGHGGGSIPMVSLENSKVNVICFYSYENAFSAFKKICLQMIDACMLFGCFNHQDLILI